MFDFSRFSSRKKKDAAKKREAERLLRQAELEESQKRQELLQSSFNIQHVKLLNETFTGSSPKSLRRRGRHARLASVQAVDRHQPQFSYSSLEVSTRELESLELPLGGDTNPSFPEPRQEPLYQVDVFTNICNFFWKASLSFHPYQFGQSLVGFGSLWPDEEDLEVLLTELCETTLRRSVLDLSRLVVYCGPLRALKVLLDLNIIGVNQMFENGNSILHASCLAQNFDAALYLCTCGADTKRRNKNGHTADQLCFCPRIKKLLPQKYHGSAETEVHPEPSKKVPTLLERQLIFESAECVKEFDDLLVKLQTFEFDVNLESDENGDFLVHICAAQGVSHVPLLILLQKICSADIDLPNQQGLTPVMISARLGHSVLIDTMVCVLGADPNVRNTARGGWTALHYACQYSQLDSVSILVKRGADFNLECDLGQRPDDLADRHGNQDCKELLQVARRRRVEGLIALIAKEELRKNSLSRTDLWVTDIKGNTLLMTAAEHSAYSALDTLVKMPGAPIDAQHEKTLMTAVAMAAQMGHAEVVQLLLKSGANPAIHDIQGLMPLHHAVVNHHAVTVEIIVQWPDALTGLERALKLTSSVEIRQKLSRAKHRRQLEMVTPVLFESAMTGDAQKLYCMLEEGDNVNPTGGMGSWPVYLAVENGHQEIVRMLFECGADISRRHPTTGNTVLHMACARGHLDIVRFLLQRYERDQNNVGCAKLEAAVNLCNKQGKTPLVLASEKGYSQVVQLLLDHGASTAIVDSSGELYGCEEYQGVQVLLETYRMRHVREIIDAIRDKHGMRRLQHSFMSKFDHHLRDFKGDTPLMVACREARLEPIKFLLQSAVYTQEHSFTPYGLRRHSSGISNGDSGAVFNPNSTLDQSQDQVPVPEDRILTSTPVSNSNPKGQSQSPLQSSKPIRTNGTLPRIQTNMSLQKIEESVDMPAACEAGTPLREETVKKSPPNTAAHGEPSSGVVEQPARPRKASSRDKKRLTEPQLPETEDDEDGPYQVTETISTLLESISSVSKGSLLISGNRLSHVAAVNSKDGATAFHRLVESCDNVVLFNLLLSSDESAVNIQDVCGLSPLHLACKLGRRKIVDKLTHMQHVDLNCRTLDGKLPEEMTTNKNIVKMMQTGRAQHPPRNTSPLMSLSNSLFGAPITSLTGSSIDFEQLNTRFTLMRHQLDLDIT